ncbi:hypothetical protein Hanom_Chr04g00327151 [Helianthus anomalus]
MSVVCEPHLQASAREDVAQMSAVCKEKRVCFFLRKQLQPHNTHKLSLSLQPPPPPHHLRHHTTAITPPPLSLSMVSLSHRTLSLSLQPPPPPHHLRHHHCTTSAITQVSLSHRSLSLRSLSLTYLSLSQMGLVVLGLVVVGFDDGGGGGGAVAVAEVVVAGEKRKKKGVCEDLVCLVKLLSIAFFKLLKAILRSFFLTKSLQGLMFARPQT